MYLLQKMVGNSKHCIHIILAIIIIIIIIISFQWQWRELLWHPSEFTVTDTNGLLFHFFFLLYTTRTSCFKRYFGILGY
jgi:predicted Na+-dependent transporter